MKRGVDSWAVLTFPAPVDYVVIIAHFRRFVKRFFKNFQDLCFESVIYDTYENYFFNKIFLLDFMFVEIQEKSQKISPLPCSFRSVFNEVKRKIR